MSRLVRACRTQLSISSGAGARTRPAHVIWIRPDRYVVHMIGDVSEPMINARRDNDDVARADLACLRRLTERAPVTGTNRHPHDLAVGGGPPVNSVPEPESAPSRPSFGAFPRNVVAKRRRRARRHSDDQSTPSEYPSVSRALPIRVRGMARAHATRHSPSGHFSATISRMVRV